MVEKGILTDFPVRRISCVYTGYEDTSRKKFKNLSGFAKLGEYKNMKNLMKMRGEVKAIKKRIQNKTKLFE